MVDNNDNRNNDNETNTTGAWSRESRSLMSALSHEVSADAAVAGREQAKNLVEEGTVKGRNGTTINARQELFS